MTRVFLLITTIYISFFFFHLTFVSTITNTDGKQEVKTKLCGDPKCQEVLFSTKFIRDYNTSDDVMLSAQINFSVMILAIKFSNRPDFFEAKNDAGKRGYIFIGFTDLKPYVQYMESALKKNLTLYLIEQDTGKSIREVNALPELIRDYSKHAKDLEDYPVDKELFNNLVSRGLLQDDGLKQKQQKESISEHNENLNKVNNVEPKKSNQKQVEYIVGELKKEDNKPGTEPENGTKLDESQINETKGEKENASTILPILNDLPAKTDDIKKEDIQQLKNEQNSIEKIEEKPQEQKVVEEKPLEENIKIKAEDVKTEIVQENEPIKTETVNNLNQPPSTAESDEFLKPKMLNEQSQPPLEQKQQQFLDNSSSSIDYSLPQTVSSESIPTMPDQQEQSNDQSKIFQENASTILPILNDLPVKIDDIKKEDLQQLKNEQNSIEKIEEQKIEENLQPYPPATLDKSKNKNTIEQQNNLPHEIVQEQKEEEKFDYCYKEDCLNLDGIHTETVKSSNSKFGNLFRTSMASIRALLPEPFCYFEDTGLIILLFVIITIFLHLANMSLSKIGDSGPDRINPCLLHDCITRLKEQEVIIEQLNVNEAETQRLREIAMDCDQLNDENKHLVNRIHSADEEITYLKEELNQTLANLSQIQNREKYLDENLKETLTKLDQLKIELDNSLQNSQKWQNQYKEKKAEADELLEIISELKDQDNGAGSSASNGWSDIGDGVEVSGDKNTTKQEILKMAKLEKKLRLLETEKVRIEFLLKAEKEEKENLSKEMDQLKQGIIEKERDFEQREMDRHGITQQCSKLLQMMEEKEKKIEYSDSEREKIRCRLSEVELSLHRVEDEKRELQYRFKELEQSLKQSNELNGKLENKLFHEERKMNAKLRQLEEQLITAKQSQSPLDISLGNSEADGGGEIDVPSLWSEIETSEPVDELVNIERKASMRRRRSIRGENARESPFLGDIVHISSSGREERFNTSKYSSISSSTTTAIPRQRMRSRSAGRQSARLTGVSSSIANPLYSTTIGASTTSLNRQRSSILPASGKSSPYRNLIDRPSSTRPRNNLYTSTAAATGGAYSSDSNGASSPPPEMPLLSGVPPPGLNKRPTIILPQNIQLHKPANILPK